MKIIAIDEILGFPNDEWGEAWSAIMTAFCDECRRQGVAVLGGALTEFPTWQEAVDDLRR